MSTGISYALIDNRRVHKLPLAMMGYGRTDAVDGSVFPYAFPLVTTYQMQAPAIVKFIKEKLGGNLAGKKTAKKRPYLPICAWRTRRLERRDSSATMTFS